MARNGRRYIAPQALSGGIRFAVPLYGPEALIDSGVFPTTALDTGADRGLKICYLLPLWSKVSSNVTSPLPVRPSVSEFSIQIVELAPQHLDVEAQVIELVGVGQGNLGQGGF